MSHNKHRNGFDSRDGPHMSDSKANTSLGSEKRNVADAARNKRKHAYGSEEISDRDPKRQQVMQPSEDVSLGLSGLASMARNGMKIQSFVTQQMPPPCKPKSRRRPVVSGSNTTFVDPRGGHVDPQPGKVLQLSENYQAPKDSFASNQNEQIARFGPAENLHRLKGKDDGTIHPSKAPSGGASEAKPPMLEPLVKPGDIFWALHRSTKLNPYIEPSEKSEVFKSKFGPDTLAKRRPFLCIVAFQDFLYALPLYTYGNGGLEAKHKFSHVALESYRLRNASDAEGKAHVRADDVLTIHNGEINPSTSVRVTEMTLLHNQDVTTSFAGRVEEKDFEKLAHYFSYLFVQAADYHAAAQDRSIRYPVYKVMQLYPEKRDKLLEADFQEKFMGKGTRALCQITRSLPGREPPSYD